MVGFFHIQRASHLGRVVERGRKTMREGSNPVEISTNWRSAEKISERKRDASSTSLYLSFSFTLVPLSSLIPASHCVRPIIYRVCKGGDEFSPPSPSLFPSFQFLFPFLSRRRGDFDRDTRDARGGCVYVQGYLVSVENRHYYRYHHQYRYSTVFAWVLPTMSG